MSVGAVLAVEGVEHRAEDNLDVEEKRPVFNVPYIMLHAAFHLPEFLGLSPVAAHLRPSGYAGFDEVADHVLVDESAIILGVFEHVGARADDGHVAFEHVDELRELVEARAAHEVAEACLARIILGGLQGVGLSVDLHGAEFPAEEVASHVARSRLLEEYRAGRTDLDGYGEGYEEQRGEKQESPGENYVERAFEHTVGRAFEGVVAHLDHGHLADGVEAEFAREVGGDLRDVVKLYHVFLADSEDELNGLTVFTRKRVEYLIRIVGHGKVLKFGEIACIEVTVAEVGRAVDVKEALTAVAETHVGFHLGKEILRAAVAPDDDYARIAAAIPAIDFKQTV